MTVPFPADPQLPQLSVLMNQSEMMKIIGKALDTEVLSCMPKYVRYKPNTSCIVQYALGFALEGADPITRSAHIKVYADRRAEAKASGSRAGRLEKRLGHLPPDTPKVTYVSEVDGALQIFPADLDLRSLARIADSQGASRELKKALGLRVPPSLSAEPELIRYKPGRKALLQFQVDSVSELPLYVKVFADQSVVKMKVITETLLSAGLPTARVLGLVEDQNLIVHETAPGIALKELRHTAEYLQWIKPMAETLWHLHSVEVPILDSHNLADEIATLREVRIQLGTLLPHLAPRLDQLVLSLSNGFDTLEDVLVTSHGDFYDDQVLVADNGLTLIDLEAVRLAHPLIDAGNMLAHLTAAHGQAGDHIVPAHREFLNHTMHHNQVDRQTLALFEAAGLLKLAPGPFRRLEDNWSEGVERLLALAESVLKSSESDDIIDPALPQLATITNAGKISVPIAEATSTNHRIVSNVELIRHKPGRRAIARFQFSDSTTLYGKTFASSRGPKVFKVTDEISRAQAFGPDVLTPEAIAYLPEHKLVLLSEISGNPVEDRLCSGDTVLAERIAFALFQLHTSNVDLGRWHDLEQEFSPLNDRCADIAKHAPELTDQADELLQDIITFDHHSMCWRFRPVHRDMYHDQILMTKDHLVVLDLDDAAMSEPSVDVANFATHFLLLGLQREQNAEAYCQVTDAFLRQYAELDHDLDPHLVDYLIATTALRLSGIHVSRKNGPEIANGLLTVASDYLHSASRQVTRK